MRTSIFNGLNTGKLDFNYNIRYTPRTNIHHTGLRRQIEYLFRDVDYDHICYVWEKNRYNTNTHSHNLVKTNDEHIVQKLKGNIIQVKEPIIETRRILIQRDKTLINPNTGEKFITKQDIWENVEGTKIIGKYGEVFIEPVLSTISSSLYNHKFTDHGANFGYITPVLIS